MMRPIYFVKDSEYTFQIAKPQPCPECGDYERRYEDLLEVHGKTMKGIEATLEIFHDPKVLNEYRAAQMASHLLHVLSNE